MYVYVYVHVYVHVHVHVYVQLALTDASTVSELLWTFASICQTSKAQADLFTGCSMCVDMS